MQGLSAVRVGQVSARPRSLLGNGCRRIGASRDTTSLPANPDGLRLPAGNSERLLQHCSRRVLLRLICEIVEGVSGILFRRLRISPRENGRRNKDEKQEPEDETLVEMTRLMDSHTQI